MTATLLARSIREILETSLDTETKLTLLRALIDGLAPEPPQSPDPPDAWPDLETDEGGAPNAALDGEDDAAGG